MPDMNWVDWTILAVVTASTLLSLMRGFVKEALSLLVWVCAFFVASAFTPQMAAVMDEAIANPSLRSTAAYVILFASTLMLGTLVNALLGQLIRLTGLTGLDRLLGTAFGFARGLIVVLVMVFIARATLPTDSNSDLQQSVVIPHLVLVLDWAQRELGAVVGGSSMPTIASWF